ncbi:22653_t:CDS:2 [Cetraspora pellucida]|uniref:22653_t:CDS:1 n=1 Tax=Cetraspora pellucida TaxID=1433469 RepID=A0A9N9JQH8_9GLOM|nr:22653_t:CDS:2 [Cetraspora pellucida]
MTESSEEEVLYVGSSLKPIITKSSEEKIFDVGSSLDYTSYLRIHDDLLSCNNIKSSSLYSEKKFAIWELAFICDHGCTYESNSTKDTNTKKTQCHFLVNVSCPKINNSENSVIVNKIVDEHNHLLNPKKIKFEDNKKFTDVMLENVRFMTIYCKFGATSQRKFLEEKYPTQLIYSKDLYAAIQKFRPNSKTLNNNAVQISNWLDQKKDTDSRWIVARDWDDDNTLTRLLWMN